MLGVGREEGKSVKSIHKFLAQVSGSLMGHVKWDRRGNRIVARRLRIGGMKFFFLGHDVDLAVDFFESRIPKRGLAWRYKFEVVDK